MMKFGKERKDKFVFPYGVWELWLTINDNYDAYRDVFIDTIMVCDPGKIWVYYATVLWLNEKKALKYMTVCQKMQLIRVLYIKLSAKTFYINESVFKKKKNK